MLHKKHRRSEDGNEEGDARMNEDERTCIEISKEVRERVKMAGSRLNIDRKEPMGSYNEILTALCDEYEAAHGWSEERAVKHPVEPAKRPPKPKHLKTRRSNPVP